MNPEENTQEYDVIDWYVDRATKRQEEFEEAFLASKFYKKDSDTDKK